MSPLTARRRPSPASVKSLGHLSFIFVASPARLHLSLLTGCTLTAAPFSLLYLIHELLYWLRAAAPLASYQTADPSTTYSSSLA